MTNHNWSHWSFEVFDSVQKLDRISHYQKFQSNLLTKNTDLKVNISNSNRKYCPDNSKLEIIKYVNKMVKKYKIRCNCNKCESNSFFVVVCMKKILKNKVICPNCSSNDIIVVNIHLEV